MSFTPVRGAELNEYDDETRQLYSLRTHDHRLSYALATIPRRNRHNLPVVVNQENPMMQELQKARDNQFWRCLFASSFFSVGVWQFGKSKYPAGIIVRRAIPTTALKQFGYYAPLMSFFAVSWWLLKEAPRSRRSDMTSDDE